MAYVSNDTRQKLLAVALLVDRPKGRLLFRRGETAFGIFLICKGSVRLQLEHDDGRVISAVSADKYSTIGLPGTLSGARYSLTAVVERQAHLAFVERSTLLELLTKDTGVGLELLRALSGEIARVRYLVSSVSVSNRKPRKLKKLKSALD